MNSANLNAVSGMIHSLVADTSEYVVLEQRG